MRALFLACSKRKAPGIAALPAVERYDGPAYRVLHNSGRLDSGGLRVWILSAKYGLIPSDERIGIYDMEMTRERAENLRVDTLTRFRRFVRRPPDEAFFCMGEKYMHAMSDCERWLAEKTSVKSAVGLPIGGQISRLKSWLNSEKAQESDLDFFRNSPTWDAVQIVRIGGKKIKIRAQNARKIARAGLAEHSADAARFQTWHVPIVGGKVAAKWLVAELSGLPVSKFRTADALRILRILGIPHNRRVGKEL